MGKRTIDIEEFDSGIYTKRHPLSASRYIGTEEDDAGPARPHANIGDCMAVSQRTGRQDFRMVANDPASETEAADADMTKPDDAPRRRTIPANGERRAVGGLGCCARAWCVSSAQCSVL